MFHLHGECAHAFEIASRNIQAFRREIEFLLRHGFGRVHNFLFDVADIAVKTEAMVGGVCAVA